MKATLARSIQPAPDSKDPFPIDPDLGMDFAEGLEPPTIPLPEMTEKLWLLRWVQAQRGRDREEQRVERD